MMYLKRILSIVILLPVVSLTFARSGGQQLTITHGDIHLEINEQLHTRLSSPGGKPLTTGFSNSEFIHIRGIEQSSFSFRVRDILEKRIEGNHTGKEWAVTAVSEQAGLKLRKTVIFKVYDSTPGLISTRVVWANLSDKDIVVEKWANNFYDIVGQQDVPAFWAFQGSSTKKRSDWIRPVTSGYFDQNFMGMNDSDYGGGIPVTSVWRPDRGAAVGHLALVPKQVSLPTEYIDESFLRIGVEDRMNGRLVLNPNKSIETLETFVMVHRGDYYNALSAYSTLMQQKGIRMARQEPDAFESIWCAWGYERNFTMEEILGTLPKVKELGIKWAVLDDGFQYAEGDWNANKERFKRGDVEIKELVQAIHDKGLKAKIWWTPLAADPYSKLLTENPDMQLEKKDGAPQYITWWDAHYLSPTKRKVMEHTKETIRLFMEEWRFDGMKMDGQHMNAIAPDYSSGTKVSHPNEAPEKLPEYFQMIYDEATRINPNAVIENCPCGTCMSFFNMPSMNQAVASDPLSSWQIRHKGKTYKALIPQTAYFGDHVELSDNASDFASSFGVGAVLGTKFTWPKDNPTVKESFLLTPEKEVVWKKWFSLYDAKKLSKEEYLGGLYDIGYHIPETHVIKKGDILHYAFYNESWKGHVEFRGLDPKKEYEIYDYYHDRSLGRLQGSNPSMGIRVDGFLLVEARPVK